MRYSLADLTCDSDGKIDRFIDQGAVQSSLAVHSLDTDASPYYLGIFLVGAYQEIMGNLHNLFGDVNVVHVGINSQGSQIQSVVKGETITDVLESVQYSAADLQETLRRYTEQALAEGKISLSESRQLLADYEQSLRHYTYLVSDHLTRQPVSAQPGNRA